jgi:hypothetical protein
VVVSELEWLDPTEPAGFDEEMIEAGPRWQPPRWVQHAGRSARIPRVGWFALAPVGLIASLLVGPAVGAPVRPQVAVPSSHWGCEQRAVRVTATAPLPGLLVEYMQSRPSEPCRVVVRAPR